MSTPGTPLPDEVEYTSHIESPTPTTTYCAYDPYENSEEIPHAETSEKISDATPRTFLDYRTPEPTMSGGVTSSSTGTTSTGTGKSTYTTTTDNTATGTTTTGHSGAINQTAYADPNSAEFRNRKLPDIDSTHLTGADPSRRRRSSSAGKVANVGLTSNYLVGNQKTGHDAVNDIAKNTGGMMGGMGRMMGGSPGSRSWSEQPLVLAMIWLGIVGVIYAAWVFLGRLNPEGKRELIL